MSKILYFFLSVTLYASCIPHRTKSQSEIPRYAIDLDQPADTRWQIIAQDYAAYLPYVKQILKEAIPAGVLPLFEEVALYLDTVFDEPYPGEMKGLAAASNLSVSDVILANLYYDLTAYCTSIVAQDDQGIIYHARNLDYGSVDYLRKMTIFVEFFKNGKVIYSGITFAGYIGILTGQKPYAFTVTMNERDKGFIWENIVQLLLAKAKPIGFFLRSLLAHKDSDFDYSIKQIADVQMIAPAYIILGGVSKGQGAVITRERTETLDIWKLNVSEGRWFLVETNYDHWTPPPLNDDRRDPAIKAMNEIGRNRVGLKGLFQVMSTKPVLNNKTVFTTIMSAKFSMFTTWTRGTGKYKGTT